MAHPEFDATITLNDHHLAAAGISINPAEAVAAVRRAVECMAGAGWIDVEAHSYPVKLPGWVILYPPGHPVAPDTADWPERIRAVEGVVTEALDRCRRISRTGIGAGAGSDDST
jgi:hypothetical protein